MFLGSFSWKLGPFREKVTPFYPLLSIVHFNGGEQLYYFQGFEYSSESRGCLNYMLRDSDIPIFRESPFHTHSHLPPGGTLRVETGDKMCLQIKAVTFIYSGIDA